MKRTFFSSYAVGIMLAALGFLTGCQKEERIYYCYDGMVTSFEFVLLSPSKGNLVGSDIGQIKPEDIKLSSPDNVFLQRFVSVEKPSQSQNSDAYGVYFEYTFNQSKLDSLAKLNKGKASDLVFYLDLPNNDRDTIRYSGNNTEVLYNGVKSFRGRANVFYLVKKSN